MGASCSRYASAGLQGGQFANYDADLGKLKWPYLFVHSDFMLNFSNWAGGYRDDRAYYLVPFVGFGYLATNFTDKSQEDNMTGTHQAFAFSYGLLNKFRLSRSFDFNIELKGMLAPSRVCPAKTDGSYLFGFSATAGFTYRFNKRGWQRGVAGYTAADIQAFQDAVAASMAAVEAAEHENAQLAQQARRRSGAGCRRSERRRRCRGEAAAVATVVAADEAALADTSIILFDYSMSVLTPQEKTRLELIAEQIKSGSKDAVYQIVGHADQQTGTAAGNKRVAEHRAKRRLRLPRIEGRESQAVELRGQGQLPRSLQEGSGRQPRRDYPVIPAGRNDRFARSARPDKKKGCAFTGASFFCVIRSGAESMPRHFPCFSGSQSVSVCLSLSQSVSVCLSLSQSQP
ncbi:MAG: OmpA family protein [Alistipes finegoldii]